MNLNNKESGSLDINQLISQLQDSADPVLWQYFKNLNNRTIVINEGITESIIESAVLPLLEMDNDGTGEEITILLSSHGGSTYHGLTLCDVIDRVKTPVKIVALSYIMSMGALIMMAGYKNPNVTKVCYPFTVGLIHGGSQLFEGTLSQARDYWSFNEKYEEMIKQWILNHSSITEEEYTKMEKSEWYMTSDDLLKHGIVDTVL